LFDDLVWNLDAANNLSFARVDLEVAKPDANGQGIRDLKAEPMLAFAFWVSF
jgi:hypothetical protein